MHEEKAGKTWTSFLEFVTFHLQSLFYPNAAEAVKYYITNIEEVEQDSKSAILSVSGATEQLPRGLAKLVPEPKG